MTTAVGSTTSALIIKSYNAKSEKKKMRPRTTISLLQMSSTVQKGGDGCGCSVEAEPTAEALIL